MNNSSFRTKTHDIKQFHVSFVSEKRKNGDIIVPIPEEIKMAYELEVGDAAVFEIIKGEGILIRFVKKGMWNVVEKYQEPKRRKQIKKRNKGEKNVRKPVKI